MPNAEMKETRTYSWAGNLKYRGKLLQAVYVEIAGDDGKTMRLEYLSESRKITATISNMFTA